MVIFINFLSWLGSQLTTIKLLLLLNVFGFGAMLLSTLYLSKGAKRLAIIGWICLVFNISVFAAPLFIIVRILQNLINKFLYKFFQWKIQFQSLVFDIHEPMINNRYDQYVQRRVIKTRSVEYMPFTLSMFLTINAVMWFFYGLLLRDYYVAVSSMLYSYLHIHFFFFYL